MKLDEKVALVFENKEGKKVELITSVKDLLNKTLDDFYDELEPPCTESSCNNESQNFCDCGPIYEDYEVKEVTKILVPCWIKETDCHVKECKRICRTAREGDTRENMNHRIRHGKKLNEE